MKIELADPFGRMSESGSSLLRLIQNNNTARLDLLIRESLQNSLDAGNGKSDHVRVDYFVRQADTGKVAPFFEGISDKLNTRYPGNQTYIAIRDTNTVGLTGPIRKCDIHDNSYGNYLKLVSEISKPQEQEGAGGSWGLGKTVYFRIGIGLVIYYSRIFNEGTGKFESRLSAACVENEKSEDRLLPETESVRRGIAWWGQEDLEHPELQQTIPVTDESEIGKLLEAFEISPFGEEETGTEIIIPFVNENSLLHETYPEAESDEMPPWCADLVSYLKVAVQRWYAPRLYNKEYDGQYLEFHINGQAVTRSSMAPLFHLIQELYNARQEGDCDGVKVFHKPVNIRNVLEGKSTAGWISYAKVTTADLHMDPPDNLPNPYKYINKQNSDTEHMYNDPIITYTRRPGMIVSYSTTDDWTDGIPKTNDGEFIVAVFRANSDIRLVNGDMTLEEYIRNSEKADHMVWDDWTVEGKNPGIVAKIKNGVRKKIKSEYGTMTVTDGDRRNLGLGKLLADFFMPSDDFDYNWDERNGGGKGKGGTGGDGTGSTTAGSAPPVNQTSHVIFKQIGNPEFTDDGISLPVRVSFGRKKYASLQAEVNSERGLIPGEDWEAQLQTPFPVELKSFTLNAVYRGTDKGKKRQNLISEPVRYPDNQSLQYLSIKRGKTKKGICNELKISLNSDDYYILEGDLCYEPKNVQGIIKVGEEE